MLGFITSRLELEISPFSTLNDETTRRRQDEIARLNDARATAKHREPPRNDGSAERSLVGRTGSFSDAGASAGASAGTTRGAVTRRVRGAVRGVGGGGGNATGSAACRAQCAMRDAMCSHVT